MIQVHPDAKTNGIYAQESRKGLKRSLMASSKKSEAQEQVENHITYIPSVFKSLGFFLIFITLSLKSCSIQHISSC